MSGKLKLLGLHPQVKAAAEWALAWADFYDVPITVTSGFRSWEEQAELRTNFERCVESGEFGRSARCAFPANAPGDSAHNWGLAWDSTTSPQYQGWWNEVRRLAGFEVLSNDLIHAQVPGWRGFV